MVVPSGVKTGSAVRTAPCETTTSVGSMSGVPSAIFRISTRCRRRRGAGDAAAEPLPELAEPLVVGVPAPSAARQQRRGQPLDGPEDTLRSRISNNDRQWLPDLLRAVSLSRLDKSLEPETPLAKSSHELGFIR